MNTSLRQSDCADSQSGMKESESCEVTATRKPVTGDSVAPVSPAISPAVNPESREKPITETRSEHQSGNQSGNGNTKANCYECKYRRGLAGDCHSSCEHPFATGAGMLFMMLFANGHPEGKTKQFHIRGNTRGVRSGWFMWPLNFDPAWLEICSGFDPLDSRKGRN